MGNRGASSSICEADRRLRDDQPWEHDGRRIEFRVRATEGDREIGVGSHSRAVIDMAKFMRRRPGALGAVLQ